MSPFLLSIFNLIAPSYEKEVVLSPKAVVTELVILGIVLPLPSDQELVLIPSREKHNSLLP